MELELKIVFDGRTERDLSINTKIDRLRQINKEGDFLIIIDSFYSSPYRLGKIPHLDENGVKPQITLAIMQNRFDSIKYDVDLRELVAVYELPK